MTKEGMYRRLLGIGQVMGISLLCFQSFQASLFVAVIAYLLELTHIDKRTRGFDA